MIRGLLAVPLSLLYLTQIDERIINIGLGIILILFATFRLLNVKFRFKEKSQNMLGYPVGFLSGILSAACYSNGPPVIMLLSLQNWKAKDFRSTLQSYFFLTGIGMVAGHFAWGNVTGKVLTYFLARLWISIVTFLLGEGLFGKLSSDRFYSWVYFVLLLLGLSLRWVLKIHFFAFDSKKNA